MTDTKQTKKVLFRLTPPMKLRLNIALTGNEVGAQHVFEAMTEKVLSYHDGDATTADYRFIKKLISRAKELKADCKR